MSTRPCYKRAAASSFEVPQASIRKLRLAIAEDSNYSVHHSPKGNFEQHQDDIEHAHRGNLAQKYSEQLFEYPFPHQKEQQIKEEYHAQTLSGRYCGTDKSERWSGNIQPRLERTNSVSSTCSPSSCTSPMPSLASSDPWSPLSPITPQTPADLFGSAAHSLKQLVMADELGMTLEEIKELDAFATLSVSGPEKRAGRILAPSVEVEKLAGSSHKRSPRRRSGRKSSDPNRQTMLQSCEEWTNQMNPSFATKDWWREVNWSRFSDSSTASSCDGEDEDEGDDLEISAIRRTSSYRGCIFLPPKHISKLHHFRDARMSDCDIGEV